ncbi:hypothetical protein PQ478_17835 [Alkalihalophilus pseudofirmus]|uniref:VOC family protein n=1 Tax=Alkalihalophilus pseudofirmus TaxID=79885 RepID=UPI00259B76CA|nr:hypothetical protein [Alkalihalophilus pseudofirmus]WEG16348.1 hypothetical protein PQ478_17835 [Alkalihalophilus pseudofirmus]
MKLHHLGIDVVDLDKSTDYIQSIYQARFLFEITFGEETIRFFQLNEFVLELIYNPAKEQLSCHIAWQVDSIDHILNHISSEDEKKIEGPYQFENGWTSIFFEVDEELYVEWVEESLSK